MAPPVPVSPEQGSAAPFGGDIAGAPEADPAAIRACLTPDVAAAFDAEWEFVLDEAKRSKDLAGVRELLAKWRVFAHQELLEPGAYFRVLAVAADMERTGRAPEGAVTGAEMRARIERRLAEAGRG